MLQPEKYHFEAGGDYQPRAREKDTSPTHPLEFVICGTPHILMSVFHDTHHPIRSTPLTQSQREPIPQPFNRALSFERGKPGVEHQPSGVNKLVRVGSQSEERFDREMLEHGVTL